MKRLQLGFLQEQRDQEILVLKTLISYRIDLRLLLLVYKTLCGLGPEYSKII